MDNIYIKELNKNLKYYYKEAKKFEDKKNWCPKSVNDFYDFEYYNKKIYGIFLKDKFIGMITIVEDIKSEINVILDFKYRGRGITTYALRKVKEQFYEDNKHGELYANVNNHNIELQELYKSLDFINVSENSDTLTYVYNRPIIERNSA